MLARLTSYLVAALATLAPASIALAQTKIAPRGIYHLERSIALADGGWDLASFDPEHSRVLVARGAAVSVADLASGRSRDVGKVARGHAALAIPGTNEIAVTSGQENALLVLDASDGREIARVTVGENPDAALWDASSRTVIVMNAGSGTVSVVDPRAAKVMLTISVKPALELGAVVGPGLLAINDEDANELEWVDLKRGRTLPPLPLTGCKGPTGLAYDSADGLAMSACANGVAALVDVKTRALIKLLPIGQGPDTALFDSRRKRFLVPCGRSGTLSVFSVHGKQVVPAGTITTEASARTATLDPTSGRVYLPSAKFLPAQQGQRPAMVPGTAHLLVLSPN